MMGSSQVNDMTLMMGWGKVSVGVGAEGRPNEWGGCQVRVGVVVGWVGCVCISMRT
jgi:hypothetical protein